jgi:serine/threonine protein kinase/Tol biopolymer transport system component
MNGRLVGHYRILEKIGEGSMGEVFRAHDEKLDRDVALKSIHPASSDNPDHLRRFALEARAAASLNHPNIVAVYDVVFEGANPYIVSELLVGKTLGQRLSEGPIPIREATDYALQIVGGLTAAHKRRIVHRDLKPSNLFLTSDGLVKILDFGVAKLQPAIEDGRPIEELPTVTKHGAVVGTVAYMAPEQLRGKPVDHRADIFSFGAILYEIFSGRRAFRGETEVDTMSCVLLKDPPQGPLDEASIPLAYRELIRHCLEKEPENRFQSTKDLAFALQNISAPSPALENQTLLSARRRPSARLILPWIIATVLAIAAAVLLVFPVRHPAKSASYQRLTFELGTAFLGRFLSDGSIVYASAWNGKPVHLFSTVANSLQARALLDLDADLLAVSRKNDLAISIGATHNGQLEPVGGMLAEAPLAGGSPRERLSDVRWADYDLKGELAVVRYAESQIQLEYPVGNVIYRTKGWISHIRFSPQGDQIAFLDHPFLWDDKGTVSVTDLTGHVSRLTDEWEYTDGLAWRPDGKEVWFTAAAQGNSANLMAVTLSRKTRTLLDLPDDISLQDIAPDGRVLVAEHSKRLGMAFSTLDGKQDVDLSWHDWNVAKDISADGHVLFEDSSEAAGSNYAVALNRLDGKPPVRLGEGSAGGLSPDGKWAIAISPAKPHEVTLLPIGAGQPVTLDETSLERINTGSARYLPDGQSILVNASEPGQSVRCYQLDLNGAKPRGVTPAGTTCGPPSPDGKFLVGRPSGQARIYPMAGGASRPIPGIDATFNPVQWSQDGSALYGYIPGEIPARVYKVDIATGKRSLRKELRSGAPAGVVSESPIVVSRDGTRFAYSYNQTLSVLYLISGLQ